MLQYNSFFSVPAIYFNLHIVTIHLSYVAFFIASVASALYLVQNNALKNKQTGIIFNRLPDLSLLDKLIYLSIGLGFPILTLSIISGFIWAKNISGVYWWGYNSRQAFFLIIWLIYAVILHVRLSAKLRGKKVALLSLLAFCVIILSLFGACR